MQASFYAGSYSFCLIVTSDLRMRLVFRSVLAAASAISSPLAQAIRFSYPASADNTYSTNISFTKGDVVNVTWDVVNTDPQKFSLYLWEFVAFPPTYELVAYNVDTETKQVTLTIPCHVNSSPNWQLYAHCPLSYEFTNSMRTRYWELLITDTLMAVPWSMAPTSTSSTPKLLASE